MKRIFPLLLIFIALFTDAQDNIGYQKPPQEILDLVDVQVAPHVIIDDANEYMVLLSRNAYKSIEELSQKEMRLGGLRINPKLNIGSRTNYYNKIQIKKVGSSNASMVKGMPNDPKITNFRWSPNQTKMAFTNTTNQGVEVWVLDLLTLSAKKISDKVANANLRDVINWFKDGKHILVKTVSENTKPLIDSKNAIPTGPTISVNDGKKAQNRTYQDLLKNPNDEHNFEQLAISELYKISLDGKSEKWLDADMYKMVEFSPDGEYVMISTVEKPFSYLVTYHRFPSKTIIYSKEGQKIQTIVEVPLIEDLPPGFMSCRTGRRGLRWRNDKQANLIFVEALDGGDPEQEVEFRDELFELKSPFNGKAKSILKLINRFSYILWGTDDLAIAYDYWWDDRNTKTYLFNPSDATQKPKIIDDRNYQDKYNDPGDFGTYRNKFGKYVLKFKGDNAYLLGDGFTKDGQFPFVDEINLVSNQKKRIYKSDLSGKYESIRGYDPIKNELLVRIESPNEYPNYYFRNLGTDQLTQLIRFRV